MTNNILFFSEWNVPSSGIDTISIWIHPYLIKDFSMFHEKGNINKSVNLRKKHEIAYKIQKPIRTNYFIDIQAEAINPNINILDQIFMYIFDLFNTNILFIRNISDEAKLIDFLKMSFNALFSINFIDFYFDIKNENVILLGDINPNYPNTQYSTNGCIKTYDRKIRLKHKNTISYEIIDEIINARRIEFHLTRTTCRYLNCINLHGTFDFVFHNHLNYLARQWLKYKRQIIKIKDINEIDNFYLKKIDNLALSRTIPHNKALEKSPPMPIPYKKAKQNEVDLDWFPKFISDKQDA
jgi:hypothetical protein